jgi:ribosomal protein S28E/S33
MASAEIKFTAPLRVGDVLTLLSAERPPQAVRVEAI